MKEKTIKVILKTSFRFAQKAYAPGKNGKPVEMPAEAAKAAMRAGAAKVAQAKKKAMEPPKNKSK
jgi:hypothetical protein